jgi:phosphoribosylglycinamide formyltransferase-1
MNIKLLLLQMLIKNIAIFASGNGSNAQRISDYFSGHPEIHVALILSNNPQAYVMKRAEILNIPAIVFNRGEFYRTGSVLEILQKRKIEFIVLAGFLWMIPGYLLNAFPGRIINIHPALLPKYGGKGMYGIHVHEAVLASRDKESGISIHLVNERYDDGQILFQERCPVKENDTPETLAQRVHELEYRNYPVVIEQWIRKTGSF